MLGLGEVGGHVARLAAGRGSGPNSDRLPQLLPPARERCMVEFRFARPPFSGRLVELPPRTVHCSPAQTRRTGSGPYGLPSAARTKGSTRLKAVVGCEHCGFLATADGPIASSHPCPKCGKRLREVGLIETRDLGRERRRGELFRAQAASRKLGQRVGSWPSS